MKELLSKIEKLCYGGAEAALVTIIWTKKSSSPWPVGSKMIVHPSGRVIGSLGRGFLQEEAKKEALLALKDGRPREALIFIDREIAGREGKVCGGPVKIFVETFPYKKVINYRVWDAYFGASGKKERAILGTVIQGNGDSVGEKFLFYPNKTCFEGYGSEVLLKAVYETISDFKLFSSMLITIFGDAKNKGFKEEIQVFLEVEAILPEIVILGGGDASQTLATLAEHMGFKVIVVDEDPYFARRERFPEADDVYCTEFEEYLACMESHDFTYFVVMTRGHCRDQLCVQNILNKEKAYIGMIGNPDRVKETFAGLTRDGFNQDQLAKIHAPIGLELGAKTYQEIALSIIAQIVQIRRGKE